MPITVGAQRVKYQPGSFSTTAWNLLLNPLEHPFNYDFVNKIP